jgi:hypothetical protein
MLAITMPSIRRGALLLCTAAALAGSAVAPTYAGATELSSGGLVEKANKASEEEATATATTATTGATETSSSIPSGLLIAGLAAGALLLGGIAFVILRDARSVAPVVEGSVPGGGRNPEVRLRKRRAKAKAARKQRKRNMRK